MSQRLFVGNLPPGVTENDIKHEFNAYGTVKDVELKIKENLVDPENPVVFAFVTLDINQHAIKQCINEFKQQEYRGRYLNVSVARENFLDRLKREREEANLKSSKNLENVSRDATQRTQVESSIVRNQPLPQIEKEVESSSESKSSSESESSAENQKPQNSFPEKKKPVNGIREKEKSSFFDEEEITFITKKKASHSLQYGKIKIERVKTEPIHVIGKKLKDVKELDEKAKIADLKRKQSLCKMKNQYNQQKLAIQKALASVDTNKSKKVVFDDDDKNDENQQIDQVSKKINLFDGDDEDEIDENYEKDFEIKKQYEGKSGEKLMKLQSRFKSDPRFKMDEKFLDDDDDGNQNVDTTKSGVKSSSVERENDDERKWQLGIIEQVVGCKLETLPESHKKKFHKTMLRYDPTKQEDERFLRNVETVKDIGDERTPIVAMEADEKPVVSKEQFYTVNQDLKKVLKQKSDGFSLLSLFERSQEENTKSDPEKDQLAKPLQILKPTTNLVGNPFKYDSSDSEPDDAMVEDSAMKADSGGNKTTEPMEIDDDNKSKATKGGKVTKAGVWHENFFIFEGDQRLKDGILFFREPSKNDEQPKEDYDNVREKLRILIKQKIVKSKKNMKFKKPRKGKFRRK